MFPDPIVRERFINDLRKEIEELVRQRFTEYIDKLPLDKKIKEALLANFVEGMIDLSNLEELLENIDRMIYCIRNLETRIVETDYIPKKYEFDASLSIVTPKRVSDAGDRIGGHYVIATLQYQTWDTINMLPRTKCTIYITSKW